MKILLILVICALLVSCTGGKEPDTDTQGNEPPLVGESSGGESEAKDDTETDETSDGTETDETDSAAPADETGEDGAPESVSASDENKGETLASYTVVNSGDDVLYLTALYNSGYGDGGESVTEYKIEGALIFPHIPSSMQQCYGYETALSDERDTRGFILADRNLYNADDNILSGGAAGYEVCSSATGGSRTADELHSLNGAELISGERDDGGKYCFYKMTLGDYTWYYGFVTVSESKMAAIAYIDKGGEDAGWDDFLPLVKKMRAFIAGDGELEYKINITAPHEVGGKEQWDEKYSLSFTLPDDWLIDGAMADDCERAVTGVYSTKRLDIGPGVYSPERYAADLAEAEGEPLAPVTETTAETKMGYGYTYRTSVGADDNPDCVWHTAFVAVPDTSDYVMMSFVEYKEDSANGADWFAEKCLPVLDSVVIDTLDAE